MSRLLGPLLLKNRRFGGWFVPKKYKWLHLLSWVSYLVDSFLSYLPVKRIWRNRAVCASDIKLGFGIILNPKNIGNNTIFFLYPIGMTAIVIVMSLVTEKSANFWLWPRPQIDPENMKALIALAIFAPESNFLKTSLKSSTMAFLIMR